MDNSASLQTRPSSLIYRGLTVQTNRATSVDGVVTDNIESTGRVELHSGADVKGNISYATMAIEHGAKLFGMMSSHDGK